MNTNQGSILLLQVQSIEGSNVVDDSSNIQLNNVSQQLLLSIAEQMKVPLLQISRQAEIGSMGLTSDFTNIQTLAENALSLIDGYSLGLQLNRKLSYELESESVSVSSILYDADQQLKTLARLYNVQLELNIGGKYGPVLAHKKGLLAAIIGLASAIIEALPSQPDEVQKTLSLATHRCRYGIVAGVYANIPGISSDALKRGRKLYGFSRQPLVEISHTSGAGIFVADAILKAMKLNLHVSRHRRMYGLGVVLQPSSQLTMV